MNTSTQMLQSKLLEIIEDFDKICNKNDIVYYLMGGSALGAVRHEGFIPWDDDFDVFMDEENYTKFLSIAEDELNNDKYFLQRENSSDWPMFFTKIRMKGTTFIENDYESSSIHQGIFIDIFCLVNMYQSGLLSRFQFFSARYLTAQRFALRGYKHNKKSMNLILFLLKLTYSKKVSKYLLSFIRGCSLDKSVMCAHFFGKAPYSKSFFDRRYLGEKRLMKFENLSLPVPMEVEKYLEKRFGDYMSLPSEAERIFDIHAIIVDLDKDYTTYIKE